MVRMYSIEVNEMVYWFESEDTFKQVFNNKGANLLGYSDLAFNNATREVVKCRYDLGEIIDYWLRNADLTKTRRTGETRGEL